MPYRTVLFVCLAAIMVLGFSSKGAAESYVAPDIDAGPEAGIQPGPPVQPDASLPPQMDAGSDVDAGGEPNPGTDVDASDVDASDQPTPETNADAGDEPSDAGGGCSVHAAHPESKTAWLFLLGIATALRLRRPRKP